jgi:integrase
VLSGLSDHNAITDHIGWMRLRGLSQRTITARRDQLNHTMKALPAGLLAATRDDLLAWRAGVDGAPGTIRCAVSHVRQFYVWAQEMGHRQDNPALGIPTPKPGRLLPRPISEEDLARALVGASGRMRLWLVLAAWCGLRAKEIALMRRENILERSVPPRLIVAQDATKGNRERIVPLSAFVVDEVILARLPASGYAFPRRDGRRGPNTPQRISQLTNSYLHDCGVPDTLHQLRHRFGTEGYRGHQDLRAVQELMGHASPATTAIYTEIASAAAMAVVEALPLPGDSGQPQPGIRSPAAPAPIEREAS